MFRSKCRSVAIAVVVLSLVALVPSAHALPADSGETAPTVSWLGATLSWLQSLLPGGGGLLGGLDVAVSQSKRTSDPTLDSSLLVPMTGSCIDPQGTPRPWCQY